MLQNNNLFAIIRVSTEEQNEARQVIEMSKLGVPKKNMLIEKESGKSTERTKYHNFIKRLKKGNILYMEDIDRLARDYDTILEQWNLLTKKMGVIIKVLNTPILDTDHNDNNLLTRFIRDIILLIKAFQAENEWQKIKLRQAQGISVAKAKGKIFGRPKMKITKKKIKTVKQYQNKEITFDTALKLLKLKKTAFYDLYNIIKKL